MAQNTVAAPSTFGGAPPKIHGTEHINIASAPAPSRSQKCGFYIISIGKWGFKKKKMDASVFIPPIKIDGAAPKHTEPPDIAAI